MTKGHRKKKPTRIPTTCTFNRIARRRQTGFGLLLNEVLRCAYDPKSHFRWRQPTKHKDPDNDIFGPSFKKKLASDVFYSLQYKIDKCNNIVFKSDGHLWQLCDITLPWAGSRSNHCDIYLIFNHGH